MSMIFSAGHLSTAPGVHIAPPFSSLCCHQSFRQLQHFKSDGVLGDKSEDALPLLGIPMSSHLSFFHSFGKHSLSTVCARHMLGNQYGSCLQRSGRLVKGNRLLQYSMDRLGFKDH